MKLLKEILLTGLFLWQIPLVLTATPDTVDWRTTNIVTPAKSQGGCGSAYAFATLAAVESAIAQKTGRQMDLSEQQVIDCSYRIEGAMNGGCNGGHEITALNYIKNSGLVEEAAYPYKSGSSRTHYACSASSGGPHGRGLAYTGVNPGDEQKLKEAIATLGPMIVSISGENRDFQLFRGGSIYDNPSCPKNVDHKVLLIGYGTQDGRDYWLIKNSWGSSWGENGFGKVLRGVNQCGIVSDYAWSVKV